VPREGFEGGLVFGGIPLPVLACIYIANLSVCVACMYTAVVLKLGSAAGMIDDITIAYRFPPGHDFHLWSVIEGEHILRTTHFDKRRRKQLSSAIVRGRGMVLRLCDETREVHLKLSIPRTHWRRSGNDTYNFPLFDNRRVEDFNLIPPARFVLDTLGLELPRGVDDPTEVLRLDRWPVMRVAYALDVNVGAANVAPTLRAIADIDRAHSGRVQVWTEKRQTTGVQFAGGDRFRAMFYSKEAEIRSRIKALLHRHSEYGGRGSKEFKEHLATEAAGVIRFEITFIGATKLRDIFKFPPGMQPTFKLMANRGVADYLLWQELHKLRLTELADVSAPDETTALDPSPQNDLLRQLCTLVRTFNSDEANDKNSRRDHISLSRVYAMLGYYMTSIPNAEVARCFGGGESTLKDLARDLRAVGLPRMATTSVESHRRLAALVDAFIKVKPELPTELPILPDDCEKDGWAADSPWVGELVDYDELSMSDDDEQVVKDIIRSGTAASG
jgi:hypothetical protein